MFERRVATKPYFRTEETVQEDKTLPKKEKKGIPSDLVEEVSGKRRDRPPMNQAQNPMHDAEIEKERKRIYEELKKRDEKLERR